MLYKLTILSIQHVLEGNTKETLIDLVGMCAALLRFAERSTYIRIQMKEGAQGAQQFDPGYNGVMSHAINQLHALRLIQGQGSQDLVNPQAGQYSATAMGPGQQIPQLVTFTLIQIIQQFYSGQLIPKPQMQQPFQGFCMYPGIQQFQGFPQPSLFQKTQPSSGYSIQLYRQLRIIKGLPQFMQNPPTFGLQQTQQSNLLTPQEPSSADYPSFQSSFQNQNPEQSIELYSHQPTIRPPTLIQQQQSQAQEPAYINGRQLESPATVLTSRISFDQEPLWSKPKHTSCRLEPVYPNRSPRTNNKHELAIIQRTQRFLGIKKLYFEIYRLKNQLRTPQRVWRRPIERKHFYSES
ncbi:MAG: hypothetical protein EZS28_011541 [Streblomastix strix]|uniref:Uncharacterized protein n=1 Tax=Streblomastix strix TaxID=222440 RepID=A0A5J4WDG9_9EUKA|nr:MAG: hypothetical protein EZS28_011541 [Streblomastix strix]